MPCDLSLLPGWTFRWRPSPKSDDNTSLLDPTLTLPDNNVALLARLQHKMDLWNTDKMRLTSLAWAALESNVEVFEWLLLDYGHDDQELSRVSYLLQL